jgi:hypothetical protein
MTTSFVTEHYAYIIGGRPVLSPGLSLAQHISPHGLSKLSHALLNSSLFNPAIEVTLYPLIPVKAVDCLQTEHFAFTGPDSLAASLDYFGIHQSPLLPAQFPPIAGLQAQPKPTSSWLCVSAPDLLVARKRACAILGAVALTSISRERYLQTGRSIHGGHCTISAKGVSYSFGTQAITPPISSDIHLTQADYPWLCTLSALFDSVDLAQKSRVRALEYFYRAWFDSPRERFPTLCMALDSLVAAQREHTKAAVNFIISMINEPIDQDRLRLLMKLRGAVVHGAAPDVYESEHYESYYSKYSEDPIRDLELIVAHCLRHNIFDGKLIAHPDPHAELIKQQQAQGRLPRDMRGKSIIADD